MENHHFPLWKLHVKAWNRKGRVERCNISITSNTPDVGQKKKKTPHTHTHTSANENNQIWINYNETDKQSEHKNQLYEQYKSFFPPFFPGISICKFAHIRHTAPP